jgi:Tfp pilus assembly protein PilP
MKASTIALLSAMLVGAAVAQVAPPSQTVAPAAKAAAVKALGQMNAPGSTEKPAPPSANTSAPPSKPSVMEVKSPMKPKLAAAPKTKAMNKSAAAIVKQAVAKTPTASLPANKRDPFTSPVREQGVLGPTCSVGKKCLAINAIQLRGIVKAQNGMIAVVESSSRRISYFLRENDPVFNGYVVRITTDTVVFRENVMDRLGKQSTRDIVMKVVAPVV